jgi:hypothetical protein
MQGGDKNQLPVLRKNAIKTARRAKKVSDKAAYERVETYRLTGVLFWLCGKPEKAIKWWARAIEAAEQLGAKPELAFTLKELVKRLSEPSSNYSDFKGESVDALKQRAKALFKDLKLPTS